MVSFSGVHRLIPRATPSVKLSAALFAVIAVCLSACNALNEARQVKTYANMQAIVSRLETSRAQGRDVFRAQSQYAIASEADGHDQWGNPFVFIMKDQGQNYSYLLISYGSDGQLDVASPDMYFDDNKEELILGQPERDIVFRDGLPLKNAGK